jgi:hypothetical protein
VGQRLSTAISYMFHPLLMTTYLFVMLLGFFPESFLTYQMNAKARWLIVLLVFITTFIIPAISLYILKLTNSITSLSLFDRKERILPFFYTTIFYGITAYLFSRQISSSSVIVNILIGTTLVILTAAIITIFWKISAHGVGIGGFIGFMIAIKLLNPEATLLIPLAIAIFASGLTLSARLKLNAHNPDQVYAGFGIGVFISFATLYFI